MQPANCLYAKVLVKQKPYSQDLVSIVVCASVAPDVNKNTAQYYTELPLQVTTLDQIHAKIATFQKYANTKTVSINIQPKVYKQILDVV